MKTKRFMLGLGLACGLLMMLAADASACGRCGLFGRLCRFNSSHHVAVLDSVASAGYAAPSSIQTFNFVNSYPGNLPLSAQGQSVYGYSLAAQAYAVDPAAVLSQAARLTSNAQALASDGLAGFNVTAQSQLANQTEVAKILAQGQTASAALLAARGSDFAPAAVQQFSFRATVENGQLKVEQLGGAGGGTLATPQDATLAAVISAKCVSCHSGATPKGGLDLSLIGNADAAGLQSVLDRLETADPTKRMPPAKSGPPLTWKEKAPFYARHEQLKAGR